MWFIRNPWIRNAVTFPQNAIEQADAKPSEICSSVREPEKGSAIRVLCDLLDSSH